MDTKSIEDIIMFNEYLSLVKYGLKIHNLSYIIHNLVIIANCIINKVTNFKDKYLTYKEENKYQIVKDNIICLQLHSFKFTIIYPHGSYVFTLDDIIKKIQSIIDSSNISINDLVVIYYNINIFLESLGYNLDNEIDYLNGTKP